MLLLSGKLQTNEDEEKFRVAEHQLRKDGWYILNPCKVLEVIPTMRDRHIPSLMLALLKISDGLCLLEGWEEDAIAKMLRSYAEADGMAVKYYAEPDKEQKYLWKLNGGFLSDDYLNLKVGNHTVMLASSEDTNDCRTHFTEAEYKALAEQHNFPENMFVKEEPQC